MSLLAPLGKIGVPDNEEKALVPQSSSQCRALSDTRLEQEQPTYNPELMKKKSQVRP